MNKFKITPKIALIIVLAAITIAGIYLYIRSSNNKNGDVSETGDRGFLSFFGERKVKPIDETTVPGVTPGQSDTGGGITAGNIDSGITTGGSTGLSGGSSGNLGSLSLRPIGINTNTGSTGGSNAAGSTGQGGAGGTGTGIGGGTNGGGTGGVGQGNTGGTNIPQVDCTPPQLPYTNDEIAELKALTERFYRIAANLHTDSDIQNEVSTRKSYYDLYNQTIDYTKQCYAELKDPKYADRAKNSSARWHPYLTEKVLTRIVKYDSRVALVTNSDKTRLNKEISDISLSLYSFDTQKKYLESLGANINSSQSAKLQILKDDIALLNNQLTTKKAELASLSSSQDAVSKDIIGTFFTEDKYRLSNLTEIIDLKVARQNNNARIDKIWSYTNRIINDSGNGSQVINNLWTPSHPYFQINPLKSLVLDKWKESLNDAPRYQPGNYPQSFMHKFRMLEDGLRVW